MEDQLSIVKKDLVNLTRLNKEAITQQRESFEQRLKEMEEEVTKVSIGRYKIELEQKQKYLKTTQRYEEQLRDIRGFSSCVLRELGLSLSEVPEMFLDHRKDAKPLDESHLA